MVDEGTQFDLPTKKADFEEHPTAKLCALVRILQHHLEEDGRPPLITQFNEKAGEVTSLPPFPESNALVPDPSFDWGDQYGGTAPDKILLFSAFPLNNSVIFPVGTSIAQRAHCVTDLLQLMDAYGIKCELLNGHQNEGQKKGAIERFKTSGRDGARVLLMSSVGTVGLNLTCAHIVIFLVRIPLFTFCIPDQIFRCRTPYGLRKRTVRPSAACGAKVSPGG